MLMQMKWTMPLTRHYSRILFVFLSMTITSPAVSAAELVDRIVAVVNDDIIRLVELNKEFEPIEKQIRLKNYPPEKERRLIEEERLNTLNNMVDEKIVDQKIHETGITISESEVDGAIEHIKSINHFSQEEFEAALTASGLNFKEYREQAKKQLLRNKLVSHEVTSSIVITQTDIQAYYEAHPDLYQAQKKYRLRNIFMAYPKDDSARPAVRSRMDQAYKALQNGASFEEIAKTYSEGINSVDGGRLGLFSAEELTGNIRSAVADLTPGRFSPVIETENGFQILYVEEIFETPAKSVSDATPEIRQKLYEDLVNEKFKHWVEELKKEAHIKIMYD